MMGGRVASAALLLVVATTACSSSHSTAALRSSTHPKACDVISAVDVERVLGAPVTRGNSVACVYVSAHVPASVASASLQVSTTADLVRFFADERAGRVNGAFGGAQKRSSPRVIAGLGDEALWDGQWLFVRAGTWLLGVSVHVGESPDLTRSTALARVGLRRLDA